MRSDNVFRFVSIRPPKPTTRNRTLEIIEDRLTGDGTLGETPASDESSIESSRHRTVRSDRDFQPNAETRSEEPEHRSTDTSEEYIKESLVKQFAGIQALIIRYQRLVKGDNETKSSSPNEDAIKKLWTEFLKAYEGLVPEAFLVEGEKKELSSEYRQSLIVSYKQILFSPLPNESRLFKFLTVLQANTLAAAKDAEEFGIALKNVDDLRVTFESIPTTFGHAAGDLASKVDKDFVAKQDNALQEDIEHKRRQLKAIRHAFIEIQKSLDDYAKNSIADADKQWPSLPARRSMPFTFRWGKSTTTSALSEPASEKPLNNINAKILELLGVEQLFYHEALPALERLEEIGRNTTRELHILLQKQKKDHNWEARP